MEIQDLKLLINVFQLIAAIFATIHYKKYKNLTEKYFLHFLWFVFLLEIFGYVYGNILEKNNNWIYNIYIFPSFLFYFYWFYSLLKRKPYRKVLYILVVSYCFFGSYIFFSLGNNELHILTYIFGSFLNLVFSIFYFSELLNSNEILNIKSKLSFWITIGLLLFNTGVIPLLCFFHLYSGNHKLNVIILISLNLILYTCYSLGFIWAKKKI